MFSRSSRISDLNIGAPLVALSSTGVIGSVLGVVGLVSVYFDLVR